MAREAWPFVDFLGIGRSVDMVNRKLIRPNLAELKEKMTSGGHSHGSPSGHGHGRSRDHRDSRDSRDSGREGSSPSRGRRVVPPEQTNAEAFYYLKQMNNQTPMVVVLDNGDQLQGHIEWYDKTCVKVHRQDAPNLLIYKHSIKFMYKLEEEDPEAAEAYVAE
jgi:RNA chaperone Hfq